MSIPVHLQNFKAAGIYRVVFDKSTIVNYDTELLRLVVGYSEQGPFNTPVYIKDPQTFVSMFGGINKKLEKRGVFFHRLAIQMLQVSPCLVLNLKKFNNETVGGATISSQFNPTLDPIDQVELKVEDIYDTTRFWTLEADKLNGLRDIYGKTMDEYINIAITDTKKTSCSVFIRKASGLKVSQYNITVQDWYSDNPGEMPEFLEKYRNNLISDFFAEIYVFRGQFTAKQVLASDTLKNYFIVEKNINNLDENGHPTLELRLREKVYDAFGDPVDTLDMLYNDMTSHPVGHYIGCLIPEFKNKNNSYAALDILFNSDIDIHNMMMSFNTDLLYEYEGTVIDLSGRLQIPTKEGAEDKKVYNTHLTLDDIYNGTATTSVLGNLNAPVIADKLAIHTNATKSVFNTKTGAYEEQGIVPFIAKSKRSISGTLYVSAVTKTEIELRQVATGETVTVNFDGVEFGQNSDGQLRDASDIAAEKFGVVFDHDIEGKKFMVDSETKTDDETGEAIQVYALKNGMGTSWSYESAYIEPEDGSHEELIPYGHSCRVCGPEKVITSINNLEKPDATNKYLYTDINEDLRVSFLDVQFVTESKYTNQTVADGDSVYGTSISFIDYADDVEYGTGEPWQWGEQQIIPMVYQEMLYTTNYYDRSLLSILKPGDCLLAEDMIVDYDQDGELEDEQDYFCDAVYVQETGTKYYTEDDIKEEQEKIANGEIDAVNHPELVHKVGDFYFHYVVLTGKPMIWPADEDLMRPVDNKYLVRMDAPLNQEIGTMKPLYLEGYVYEMTRPDGVGMWAKEQWQKQILSVLSEYKGLRTALLNKSEIDYRYVIDTFASFPDSSIKKELSYLCKQKQSAFCIANFPSVQTFTKCPYASFTDSKNVFDVQYVVKGCNRKKASSVSFSLPDDGEGASFIAFYTPLKFSDGYIDNIIPSAGLVSNLFIEKYMTRQPYYIVAGPNYGRVYASGMVGPDYKYSVDELQIIEPFGVNCMVYRPNFGTFINANQTAKQIPLSALSKVHVRELVIYLQDEVEKVLQAYQWEFNNSRTREAILARANDICARIMSNGGLQAYLNIMDESNNTPEIIDNEMAVLSTHIEPGMGCGKMVHELTLYRTGQMMSTIKGS